jgi:hypothetical protein
MRYATLLVLLLSVPALAQTPGDCMIGTAEANLEIADTRARVFNTGSLFFGNTTVNGDGYVAPKFSGNSPIFAAGVWIGGEVGGDLRVAGSTYDDFEFWPGPLDEGATLPDPDDCSGFDRIWVVSALDVERYDDEGIATPDLAEWPFDLGAPVIDGDGDPDNYDLPAGDRPEVYGHQTAFWVMNDVGNEHNTNFTEPLGVEVRVTAFASAEEPLQFHTFYRYELVNRNTQSIEDTRFGLFVDPDLGDASDDYVGSDSARSLAFVYNASNTDANYGTPPPAAGYDFLNGGGVSMYFTNIGGGEPTSDPNTAEARYNFLQGLWGDGTPLTEGGDGYMTGGPILQWAFPGAPEADQFWSEVNTDGSGDDNPPGDRRNLLASEAFTLEPGEARTFDFAVLFAQGANYLDSVAELRAASDDAQALYDAGTLFAPSTVPLPPPGTLPTPELLAPADGATFVDEAVMLSWTPVASADGYRVEVATDPDFTDPVVLFTATPELAFSGPTNELIEYAWRVQAGAGLDLSGYSDARSFTLYRYEFDSFGDGVGIVEIAYPDTDVCSDGSDDPGCDEYDGNTVWQSPNSTEDYVLTNPDNFLNDLLRDAGVIDGDNFEIRFTEACAEPGACLAVYASAVPGGGDLIASVPFALWNTGAEDDEGDDVRMIPVLRALDGTEPTDQWADTFPASQNVVVGTDVLDLPVTQRVLGLMPDRPDGYARFADAANGFGGPGATYDPDDDGDNQIDINPANDQECRRQSYYVDFCYRGGSSLIVAPLGGLDGFVLADLAGDGTTPPAGTTIRFDAVERALGVSAEGDAPGQPQALALDAAYPNPFRSAATVTYRLDAPTDVRLAAYDVLGRRVAVLAEGLQSAGEHRATFEGRGLVSGIYLLVLEADGQRQSQKVLLLR